MTRPKFGSPPVVETALSVQFAKLPGYTTAHAGWFWKEYLEKLEDDPSHKWSQAAEVPPIPDQLERFGAEDVWSQPGFKVLPGTYPQRIQLIRSDGERLVQVQDTRLILNWKRQTSAYPSYEVLLPEFRTLLRAFEAFASEAGFGALQFNQWEVVYVDHFRRGDMWESVHDWCKIFPGLAMPSVTLRSTGDETMSADWRFSLPEQRGRLYIRLRQMRLAPSNQEVLSVTSLARGPVASSQTWEQGLDFGHQMLGDTFLAVTSAEAQERWRRGA